MTLKLYASQGNSGKATVPLSAVIDEVNANIELPAPAADVRGGVFTQIGIVDSTATIPNAAPAGGTGTAAGGWDTAGNRDAAITTINETRTLALELQTRVNTILSSLESAGIMAG